MDAYCGECKKPCYPIKVNIGVGRYEYWGQSCSDNCFEWQSNCCNAPVYTNEELTINYDEDYDG